MTEYIPSSEFHSPGSIIYDYLKNEKSSDLFPYHFKSHSSFEAVAKALETHKRDRSALHEILTGQNKHFQASQNTFVNIDNLLKPDSLAVIGGQQVGLFGGPLYTLYKALTVIKLSEHLSRRLNRPVIPVFWMASDDHDFAEVNHIHLPDLSGEIQEIADRPEKKDGRIPLSRTRLTQDIFEIIGEVQKFLPETEFSADIFDSLKQAYRPDAAYAEAFGIWLQHILRTHGLVVVDPAAGALKRLAIPLFREEILEKSPTSRAVIARTDELTRLGYRPQLQLHEGLLNLYYHAPERDSIALDGDGYVLKNTGLSIKTGELVDRLEAETENFSPNAALRPLFQDTVFPTLAVVLGPSEVAYFAQLVNVYAELQIPMPVVVPRTSITILEPRAERILRKYDISVREFFQNKEQILDPLAEREIPPSLLPTVEDQKKRVDDIWHELVNLASAFDENLRKPAETARGRSIGQFDFLSKKIVQAARKKDEVLRGQINRLLNLVFPMTSPQERVFNLLPFYVRFGPDFVELLIKQMDVFNSDHHVISLHQNHKEP